MNMFTLAVAKKQLLICTTVFNMLTLMKMINNVHIYSSYKHIHILGSNTKCLVVCTQCQ